MMHLNLANAVKDEMKKEAMILQTIMAEQATSEVRMETEQDDSASGTDSDSAAGATVTVTRF